MKTEKLTLTSLFQDTTTSNTQLLTAVVPAQKLTHISVLGNRQCADLGTSTALALSKGAQAATSFQLALTEMGATYSLRGDGLAVTQLSTTKLLTAHLRMCT